ncbi:MAG: hypothetical protein FWK04_05250 [Nostoc sp. GBBB01]|uniref:Uncharacterized protein n=1 Tax=Nostoc punctiforme FACHB-252 TaxID=1357509 RepID=A0ABR8H4E7_NOSPU|nr:hypothetical protein [Nostoc punctiforme]MBD2610712.1 hypothetical protein [Nostoc punctiforme FACHB-252]MBL1198487.1 hypothetical protein [Nostoc sp. GBBB01]
MSSSSKNKEDKSKGSMDVIWKASNQIAKGYYGFLLEELEFREKSSANELKEYNHYNILPLIVTNAPLFVISKEHQKASLETGNSDELIMSEVDYLILNHAFTPPKGVAQTWLQLDIPGYQNPIDRGNNSKIAVLVVNAKKLISLLNLLSHINQN